MVLFKLLISYGLMGLFAVSLISSIIPIPTEGVIFGLLNVGKNPEMVIIILISGSIIGAYLGYLIGKYEFQRIIPFHNKEKEERMQMHFRKYGTLYLVISPWIPLVGDLAPIVAGIENYEMKRFLIVISVAKAFKCIIMVYAMVYFSIKVVNLWTLLIK